MHFAALKRLANTQFADMAGNQYFCVQFNN